MAITIEGKGIGEDVRALLIAELSANHDQDLDQALALVDIAADAGWDCLKLQTYSAESLTIRSDHPSMLIDKVWGKKNLWDLYENAAMPMEFHQPLFARARASADCYLSPRSTIRWIWTLSRRWTARFTRLRLSK